MPSLKGIALLCIICACILGIFVLIESEVVYTGEEESSVYLIYTSSGSIPQLMTTHQIDAAIIWEPVVATAGLSGAARQIAVPSELPPPGYWNNTATCVLVLHNDLISRHPDIAALISALTTASIGYVNDNPDDAKRITADWVFGTQPIRTAHGYLQPIHVIEQSFDSYIFTADASPYHPFSIRDDQFIRLYSTFLKPEDEFFQPSVAERGLLFLNTTAELEKKMPIPLIRIGYLPSSDAFAPLYVMVRNSDYFSKTYGFCLKPADPASSRPARCTLFYGDEAIARVHLVPAQSGGGMMTSIGQSALQGGYLGSVPAYNQMLLGNPSSIIQSINTGGTGVIVAADAPCDDWRSFVDWVRIRSDEGRPILIATVHSSIQEEILRTALEYEGITVRFYGSGLTKKNR